MEEKINLESEGKAIQDISKILKPLNTVSKKKVIEYVFKRLGLNQDLDYLSNATPEKSPVSEISSLQQNKHLTKNNQREVLDVRSFADQKKPKTTSEKLALVGYYLSELAKGDEKTEQFNAKDIEKYFKQAGFRLPANIPGELSRAKNAGYIEKVKKGIYKLNPVGYNLIVHTLPGQSNSKIAKPRKKLTNKTSQKKLRQKKRS